MASEVRHIIHRLNGVRPPRDVAMFDPGLAAACADLNKATYAALPEHDFDPAQDLVPIEEEDRIEAWITEPFFVNPDFGDLEHFVIDGYFVKAVGVRLQDVIVVALRGTKGVRDWLYNFDAVTTSMPWRTRTHPDPPTRLVHRGFHQLESQIHSAIEDELQKLCRPGDRIVMTGHSLGGALACLFAAQFNHLGLCPGGAWPRHQLPAAAQLRLSGHWVNCVYSFGAPMPWGDTSGAPFDYPHHRLVAEGDPVPFAPPVRMYEHDADALLLSPGKVGVVRMSHAEMKSPAGRTRYPLRVLKLRRAHSIDNYQALVGASFGEKAAKSLVYA